MQLGGQRSSGNVEDRRGMGMAAGGLGIGGVVIALSQTFVTGPVALPPAGRGPGLVLFLDHPRLDLDNNASERALRPAVVGRKNFYGSGSQWSGQLAATMMSLLNTVRLWGLNPRLWLSAYLQACAQAGGRAPDDWARFVPWQMDDRQLAAMRSTDIATIDSS